MTWKILRDIYSVFWREWRHFLQQKTRVAMSVVQPLVWFVLMGGTMNNLTQGMAGGAPGGGVARFLDGAPDYLTYVVGGILVMTTLFGGVFGGGSVIWDRRLGFLNKMLAAPISRAAIPLGKMAAIAAQTTLQCVVILGLAAAFGVRYATGVPGLLLILVIAAVFAMGMAALSLALGAWIKSMESLFAVMNLLTMPLVFASPAMFPLRAMPGWLQAVAAANPLTYVLGPIRALVYKGWLGGELLRGGLAMAAFLIATSALAVSQYRRTPQ